MKVKQMIRERFYQFIAVIFVMKLILMGLFSSDYQNELFMPFVGSFVNSLKHGIWINPYETMTAAGGQFPYPPIMLLVESIGSLLSDMIPWQMIILKNICFKLPGLLFDCIGCVYLVKMFPAKRRYIAVLYFASPIVCYATYMHGQLDIIPTTFFVAALYYLTVLEKKNDMKFVLCLTGALCSKFHIAAAVPLLFFYIMKRNGVKKALELIGTVFMLTGLIIAPFWCNGFYQGVIFNNEQSVLTKIYMNYVSVRIYIPILAVGLIYLKAFNMQKINKDLLYSLCGILFAVFLSCIPPMPGWYIWVVPFIAIFFIDIKEDKYKQISIYAVLNIVYMIYFVLAHKTKYVSLYFLENNLEFFKITDSLIINLIFTVLTCFLLYSVYLMYQMGIASNSLYKRGNLPFTIGISGDSGSGKSTLIESIKTLFGEKEVLCMEGDGDHRWERGNAMWEHFTHLNPKANYIYRQAENLEALRCGMSIRRTDYDHITGTFSPEYKVKPRPYILLCGLHALYLPQVRKNLDLKIYMDIDEKLRRFWKMQRDTAQRSYNQESIIEQIESRMEDARKYIYPQRKYSDLMIRYFDDGLTDYLQKDYQPQVNLELTMSASINLEKLIQICEDYGIQVNYDYDELLETQSVVFRGKKLDTCTIPFEKIAVNLIPNIEDILQKKLEVKSNFQGILDLVMLQMISFKMQ